MESARLTHFNLIVINESLHSHVASTDVRFALRFVGVRVLYLTSLYRGVGARDHCGLKTVFDAGLSTSVVEQILVRELPDQHTDAVHAP